ncbi:MAG: hypothetical protein K0R94_1586 [Burkholderiales bacterium]|jgi:membrane protein required for beta-lactamase induction|nr:hypothetical protein [Burkholderiales bacterium]
MAIVALVLTVILERYNLLVNIRAGFNNQVLRYISYFTRQPVQIQRQIRFIYLFACLPIILILIGIKSVIAPHYPVLYALIKLFLFILGVHILTWKEQSKTEYGARNYFFIETYAVSFFAAFFWFLVLPTGIGLMCYIVITAISNEFKRQGLDSIIYNVVVDKILFYANVIPYLFLFLFIAISGNFEDVTHYLVEQRKNFVKSFFFLEVTLREIIFIAIGKEKFKLSTGINSYNEATEAYDLDAEKFNPKINSYIVAILYRASIFFIALVSIISVANLLR